VDFKLGVLLIHGMGDQEPGFAGPMVDELKARVRRLGADDGRICFQSAWWAPVVAKRQVDLLRAMADAGELDWMLLRRFVVQSLADAVAYQTSYRPISKDQLSVYDDVHRIIKEAVRELRARIHGKGGKGGQGGQKAEKDREAPLVVIAHSLGCHMISNHVWDCRHAAPSKKAGNAFERMETLSGIVTLGCNLPLFTLSFPDPEPIEIPTPGIETYFPNASKAELAEVTRWLNFYDSDDVFGYPLKPINEKFAAAVSEDRAINAGGLLRSWNPASHTAYWTDNDVTKPAAELLAKTVKLL
jgi:hypothetical protein